MVEAYDSALAAHCRLGFIALASCLQVDACSPNAFIQEQSLDIHYYETNNVLDYLGNPAAFKYDEGYIELPSDPGSGVEIDEVHVREQTEANADWHNPVWRHDDNIVAEW